MKRLFIKTISLLLAGLLLLNIAACGQEPEDRRLEEDAGTGDMAVSVGRGRFVESAMELPTYSGNAHGTLTETSGKLRLGSYESDDWGKSWTDTPLPEELSRFADTEGFSASVFWGANGEAFYVGSIHTEDGDTHYFYDGGSGIRELDITIPPAPEHMVENSIAYRCAILPDGSIAALDSYNCLMHIDQNTGEILHTVSYEYGGSINLHDFCFTGSTLLLKTSSDEGQAIELYDLETWEQKPADQVLNSFINEPGGSGFSESFSYDPSNHFNYVSEFRQCIFTCPNEEAVYVSAGRGLYRHVLGGTAMERVMDGSQYSLGDPTRSIDGIIKSSSGDFYGECYNKDTATRSILRWRFEPDIPAAPETELKVFALYDSLELRRAMSQYRQENPDVNISLEIALEDNKDQSLSYVIGVLSESIREGSGPDLLLLDGMPYRQLMRDGLLEDITGLADGLGAVPNIVSAFGVDGKSYAVPARFTVPVLMGSEDFLSSVTDLESLAEQIEALRKAEPAVNALVFYESVLLERLTAGSSAAWYNEDGSIDREKLSTFLQLCARIYQAENIGGNRVESWGYSGSECGSLIASGWTLTERCTVYGYETFTSMLAVEKKYKVGHSAFSGQAANVFTPCCLMGISSGSGNKELCRDFLRTMLSEECQDTIPGSENLPVNEAALRDTLGIEMEAGAGFGGLAADGGQYFVQCLTATEEQIDEFMDLVGTLETPSYGSDSLFRAVTKNGAAYLRGEMELDAALDEIIAAT